MDHWIHYPEDPMHRQPQAIKKLWYQRQDVTVQKYTRVFIY